MTGPVTTEALREALLHACFDPGAVVGPRGGLTTDEWRADACMKQLAPLLAAHQQVTAERDEARAEYERGLQHRNDLYDTVLSLRTSLAAAKSREDTATSELARLRAEGEAKDRRIAELSETWTDEAGAVWSPPTAWAYAKACTALRKHRADGEALRAALRFVKAWIDTDLPAGTSRAGTVHRAITKALDHTALARAATAREG